MKRLLILSLLGALLSGCVVVPAGYYDRDDYHRYGYYHHSYSPGYYGYRGGYYGGYRGYWDHGQ